MQIKRGKWAQVWQDRLALFIPLMLLTILLLSPNVGLVVWLITRARLVGFYAGVATAFACLWVTSVLFAILFILDCFTPDPFRDNEEPRPGGVACHSGPGHH